MTLKTLALASAATLLLAGCAGPRIEAPKPLPTAPSAWSDNAAIRTEPVVLDWWTELGDPQLNQLVETALAHNADLRAAAANLKAARAMVGEAAAAKLPIGTVDGGLHRSRTAGASLQLDTFGGPSVLPDQTLVDAGTSLSWEIDLFGRIEASLREARAGEAEALWLRRATEAAVAAGVVRAWSDLAETRAQLALVRQREDLLQEVTSRLEQAQAAGGVRASQVEEARQAALALAAEREGLATAERNALRRLATLTGRPAPDGVRLLGSVRTGALPVPAYVRAGSPEMILRQRPDVARAEQRLLRATARIGVARADLYPRLSLLGSVGVTATPGQIGDAGALRFGVGPMISWGIFDMARIRARIRAAGAEAEAAGAAWETAFLSALEETDAALDAYSAQQRAVEATKAARDSAERVANLAEQRASVGQDSRITALLARAEALGTAAAWQRSAGALRSAWINTQVALGAGWRDRG